MAADSNANRHMFECYLYDYLIKRNMHQTAEIFRNEANLQFDPNDPSTIDVPQGFLLEWWSLSFDYDFFREWLQMHEEQKIEAIQECDALQAEEYSTYEEAMNELLYNEEAMNGLLCNPTPIFGIDNDTMPLYQEEMPLLYMPSSYQEVTGGMSQILLPSPHQDVNGEWSQLLLPPSHDDELLTSPLREVNMGNARGQEAEPFVRNTSNVGSTTLGEDHEVVKIEEETDPLIENLLNSFWMFEQDQKELFDYPTLGESSRNMNNLLTCGEGNTGMNEFASFTSSALREDDNESETSYCSSNL